MRPQWDARTPTDGTTVFMLQNGGGGGHGCGTKWAASPPPNSFTEVLWHDAHEPAHPAGALLLNSACAMYAVLNSELAGVRDVARRRTSSRRAPGRLRLLGRSSLRCVARCDSFRLGFCYFCPSFVGTPNVRTVLLYVATTAVVLRRSRRLIRAVMR